MAVRREFVSDLYRNLLQRPEGGWTEDEVSGHVNNPGGEQGLIDFFKGSSEYKALHPEAEQTWRDVGGVVTPVQPADTGGGGYQTQGGAPPPPQIHTNQPPPPVATVPPPAGTVGTGTQRRDPWSGSGTVTADGNLARMTGYDPTNWNDPNMQTLKYQVGRIVSRYDLSTPQAIDQIINDPDMRRMFPNARIVDRSSGMIDFGGDHGPVDVIENYGAPNARGAWQPRNFDASGNRITPGSGGGGGGGAAPPAGGGGGNTRSPIADLRDLFAELGLQYGGPGGPGITQGPLQQVGEDPLSRLITGGLAKFVGDEGQTGFGRDVEAALMQLISGDFGIDDPSAAGDVGIGDTLFSGGPMLTDDDQTVGIGDFEQRQFREGGGIIPQDGASIPGGPQRVSDRDARIARRYESARELLDKGRRTMLGDLEGDLSSRNLLSEPGIPQGIHQGGIGRITERLAPEFSRTLRDIYTDETEREIALEEAERNRSFTAGESGKDRALTREQNALARRDAKQISALQLATGFSTDQARNFLAGIGEGTARQAALSDIALRTLQTNMAWSQFLAEFGLQRDQVLAMLQQGRVDDVQELLNSFLSLASLSRGGYIGA